VINRENTNDAESLSSPLFNLQHFSASQTYLREQLHRSGTSLRSFNPLHFEVRIDFIGFLYGRIPKKKESNDLAVKISLLSPDMIKIVVAEN
jgi:hypothetical protein